MYLITCIASTGCRTKSNRFLFWICVEVGMIYHCRHTTWFEKLKAKALFFRFLFSFFVFIHKNRETPAILLFEAYSVLTISHRHDIILTSQQLNAKSLFFFGHKGWKVKVENDSRKLESASTSFVFKDKSQKPKADPV